MRLAREISSRSKKMIPLLVIVFIVGMVVGLILAGIIGILVG